MAKDDDRRRRLKAADRRRARRPAPPQNSAEPTASAARALENALLAAIVDADQVDGSLTDRDLRAALQGSLRSVPPTTAGALRLFDAFAQIHDGQRPSARLWRVALTELLEVARSYDVRQTSGRCYLQFLQSVAS